MTIARVNVGPQLQAAEKLNPADHPALSISLKDPLSAESVSMIQHFLQRNGEPVAVTGHLDAATKRGIGNIQSGLPKAFWSGKIDGHFSAAFQKAVKNALVQKYGPSQSLKKADVPVVLIREVGTSFQKAPGLAPVTLFASSPQGAAPSAGNTPVMRVPKYGVVNGPSTAAALVPVTSASPAPAPAAAAPLPNSDENPTAQSSDSILSDLNDMSSSGATAPELTEDAQINGKSIPSSAQDEINAYAKGKRDGLEVSSYVDDNGKALMYLWKDSRLLERAKDKPVAPIEFNISGMSAGQIISEAKKQIDVVLSPDKSLTP